MRPLPLLDHRRGSLETCVYCPKLCRAACPVSNAEPREALTPWGKMSTAFFEARGDAPRDEEHSATAWACTGCHGCRERCDHRNEVAATLLDARAEWRARGLAPRASEAVVEGHRARQERLSEAVGALGADADAGATPLLLGCGYALHLPAEARDAVEAARGLVGPVRPLRRCCGLALLLAGDARGAERARQALVDEAGGRPILAVDPGCAGSLRGAGVAVRLLVEEAAANLGKLHRVESEGPVRYHDPCQLGRGLGLYDEPRAVLGRALGRAPDEFDERRGGAACSGAGGLLPATMPAESGAIAAARVGAHGEAGGGEIVTACASSLRSFRKAGARASDLATWIARALRG